jgi:hypothetical protein
LLDAVLGYRVPLDLALPAAGDGVVDELLLNGEPGATSSPASSSSTTRRTMPFSRCLTTRTPASSPVLTA